MRHRVVTQRSHAGAGKLGDGPTIGRRNDALPAHGRSGFKFLLLLAGQAGGLVLMLAFFRLQHIRRKFTFQKVAQSTKSLGGFRQQVLIAKETVILALLKLPMKFRTGAVLGDDKKDHDLADEPGQARVFPNANGRAGRIIGLGHGHRPGVTGDMHDSAIWKPGDEFGQISDVERKFYTSPGLATETNQLFNDDFGDGANTFVGIFDSAGDFLFHLGIVGRGDRFEAPESAVQSGHILFGEAQLYHALDFRIGGQAARVSFQEKLEILLPGRAQKARFRQAQDA